MIRTSRIAPEEIRGRLDAMKIASFLERQDVIDPLPAGEKREILSHLVRVLAENHRELNHDELLDVLMCREALRSTGIEKGVAFPHGRVPGLGGMMACFGRCREGVDFDAFDGLPTFFFFVLLIPERAEGTHLKALALLNRAFQDAGFRRRLMSARDSEELYRHILEQDELMSRSA
jgi:nitrogen PTS system EIIA component